MRNIPATSSLPAHIHYSQHIFTRSTYSIFMAAFFGCLQCRSLFPFSITQQKHSPSQHVPPSQLKTKDSWWPHLSWLKPTTTTHLWSLKKTHLWNELELFHPSILFVLKLLNLSKMLHKQRFVVLQCMQMQAALRQTSLKQVTRNLLQQSPVTFSSQSVAFSWRYPIPQSNFKSPCH